MKRKYFRILKIQLIKKNSVEKESMVVHTFIVSSTLNGDSSVVVAMCWNVFVCVSVCVFCVCVRDSASAALA